jgi:hypothetical protein
MERLLMNAPTLDFNVEFDRWVLKLNLQGTVRLDELERSYEMMVQCAFQGEEEGWFQYRFIRWEMGDWVEVITRAEFDQRVKDIREHEGDRIANAWAEGQDQVDIINDYHPVFLLRDHWEAMIKLGLFFPSVTNRQWQGKPTNPELKAKLDAIVKDERDFVVDPT